MAFTVRKIDHRPWPVTVRTNECDSQGAIREVEQTFIGHFRPFSEAEHAAIVAEVEAAMPKPKPKSKPEAEAEAEVPMTLVLERNALYFSKLMLGWAEVRDAPGAPLAFSAEALRSLVIGPDGGAVSAGLSRAIGELRFGIAPQKNSATSPVPGESSGAGEVPTS